MSTSGLVDVDRLVQTFLDLVAVDSPTGHEAEVGLELETRFGSLGCEVRRDEIGNLVAVLPGHRDGTILVSTHMDTAGTDRGIRPVVGEDGVIRTDGSTILGADDKSGIAGCLEYESVDPTEIENMVVAQALLLRRFAELGVADRAAAAPAMT